MEETKKGSGTTDLTVGRPLTQILKFALPLVLGTLFQQLYSFADTVIVGRCLGTDALGAVGTTYSLNFLILGFVLGSCTGFGIPVAQSFGARDSEDMHKYLFNGAVLCVVLSVVFTIVTTLTAAPLLQLIHTPAELFPDAVAYIRIIFLGIPATMLFNYTSTVLHSLGDSQHPFYFLLISSFLNIGLDWLFIVPLGMGVEGAAIATVVSQLFSGLLCTWWFFTRVEGIHFTRENCVLSAGHCGRLAYIGLPMGFEYSVSAIGAFIMQDAINLLGSTAVAAQTAGEKIRQMFTVPMASVGTAMATYVGQNHGAHRTDRVRQGIRDGCILQLCYCAAAWVVLFFVKGWAVGLVLGDADPAVTSGAVEYLTVISVLFCHQRPARWSSVNTCRVLGYSVQAVISGVGELIGRALCGWLAVHSLGYFGICIANPIAWGLALLYCVFMVTRVLKKRTHKNTPLRPCISTAERGVFMRSINKVHEHRAEHCGQHTGHGDRQAAHGTFHLTHLQGLAGAHGMGRGADADALCDGVGDVEELADHLGQQVARDAGEDDDGTRQGCDAAQLSGDVHADGRGDGLRQEGGVLLPGEAQREGQSQSAAQAHQRTH